MLCRGQASIAPCIARCRPSSPFVSLIHINDAAQALGSATADTDSIVHDLTAGQKLKPEGWLEARSYLIGPHQHGS